MKQPPPDVTPRGVAPGQNCQAVAERFSLLSVVAEESEELLVGLSVFVAGVTFDVGVPASVGVLFVDLSVEVEPEPLEALLL